PLIFHPAYPLPTLLLAYHPLLPTALVICSFIYLDRHHPDLHSFPTRRSSDLRKASFHHGKANTQSNGRPSNLLVAIRILRFPPRSEEHTSELQSRFDLVCRLLLEKKKDNQTEHFRADS